MINTTTKNFDLGAFNINLKQVNFLRTTLMN